MSYSYPAHRPGVLGFVSAMSLVLSVVDVCWLFLITLALMGVSVASWFAGPWVGAVGFVLAAVLFVFALVRGCLSVLLFMAGWRTMHGEPSGLTLHTTWAWITVALDVVNLMLTAGLSPSSWWGLAYALFVLWVMSRPQVLAYFHRGTYPPRLGGGLDDEAF